MIANFIFATTQIIFKQWNEVRGLAKKISRVYIIIIKWIIVQYKAKKFRNQPTHSQKKWLSKITVQARFFGFDLFKLYIKVKV